MFTTPSGQWVQFWTGDNNTYVLETQVQSVSSCISYATLNMGTIMAAKTKVLIGNNDYVNNGASNNSTNFSLSPSVASAACEKAGNAKGNDNNIKVRYTLRY